MADSWDRTHHFCSVCGKQSFISYFEPGADNLIDRRCLSHPRLVEPPVARRTASEADAVADLVNEKLSELEPLVSQAMERLKHLTEGLIAIRRRARGVGMNTIPVEAVDNLLAEHARRFMS